MTEQEIARKANERARKIVGDHVVAIAGYPSEGVYEYLKGEALVSVIEKALLDMYGSGVHDGINEG